MANIAALLVGKVYSTRPGVIERKSLQAVERDTNSLSLEWARARNAELYTLYYKQSGSRFKDWETVEIPVEKVSVDLIAGTTEETDNDSEKQENFVLSSEETVSYKVEGLSEGTKYVFVLRADNAEREGFKTKGKSFATRTKQTIAARKHMTKLTSSKDFKIPAEAKTSMKFESSDPKIVSVNERTGKATVKGEGVATITVTAKETDTYTKASKKIKIRVLDSEPVRASGASAHNIHHLDYDNCEIVKRVTGIGKIHIPQSIGYTGDSYIIAYNNGTTARIVTFSKEGNEKEVSVPDISMGHPNGFCYADSTKLCYSVKGWGSRCVTYSPETGKYDVFNLPYGASGIAYDRDKNMFYTSSRTVMAAYSGDGKFKVKNTVGVVKHRGTTHTQDIGGHAGIMIRLLSGSSKHGTNYIDLYDMEGGKYLGTFTTSLSEIESAFCDEDGYMMILANNSGREDYILKTQINIKDIAEGVH